MVVDVDVPMENPKITVNGLFSADSIWRVSLHKSKYVLDEGAYQPISDAQVVLKENGHIVETLVYTDWGEYVSPSGSKPSLGNIYEVEVAAAKMQTVTASSTLPLPVTMTDVVFSWQEAGSTPERRFNFAVDITFQDNAQSVNFYEFAVIEHQFYVHPQTEDTLEYIYPVYIFSDDALFSEDGVDGVIFDDKLINGNQVKLTLKGFDYNKNDSRYYLILRVLSEDLYRYKVTASLQQYSSGDPFAQPVHVHNNITNGFGIFGGYSETMTELHP